MEKKGVEEASQVEKLCNSVQYLFDIKKLGKVPRTELARAWNDVACHLYDTKKYLRQLQQREDAMRWGKGEREK